MVWSAFISSAISFGKWLGERAATAAAEKMFGHFIDHLLGQKSLDDVYEALIREIPKIVQAAIHENEINKLKIDAKVLEHWLTINLGGNPADIKKPMQDAHLLAVRIWHYAKEYEGTATPIIILTTNLLFIIYKELERIEPNSVVRHQISAIQQYWRTKKALKDIGFFTQRIDFLISHTPLNMSEKEVIVRYEERGSHNDDKRLIAVKEPRFEHYFDWEGKRHKFGWKKNRGESHNFAAGEKIRIITNSQTAQVVQKEITNLQANWDAYYESLLTSLKSTMSPGEFSDVVQQIEQFKKGRFSQISSVPESLTPTPFIASAIDAKAELALITKDNSDKSKPPVAGYPSLYHRNQDTEASGHDPDNDKTPRFKSKL